MHGADVMTRVSGWSWLAWLTSLHLEIEDDDYLHAVLDQS